MNRELVDRIAVAVLYEGYILYPYRPSVKNHQRWTFGGLYPQAFCQAQNGADASHHQTECLIQGDASTAIEVTVRFLHLTARTVGAIDPPLMEWPMTEPAIRPVESLHVGDRRFQTWQEAEERVVALRPLRIDDAGPYREAFAFPGRRWLEPIRDGERIVGTLIREQQTLNGEIELSAAIAAPGLVKLTLRVQNETPLEGEHRSRNEALLRSLVSTHAILQARGGDFVSLLEPPEEWRTFAAGCQNVGVWPVLVGDAGQRNTMLSSPIILYDYPQIAPESPGDLFDGTEIDEILTLRILTMTDEEKRQMVGVDERARAMLARTEALDGEQLMRLHGVVRGTRPTPEGDAHG